MWYCNEVSNRWTIKCVYASEQFPDLILTELTSPKKFRRYALMLSKVSNELNDIYNCYQLKIGSIWRWVLKTLYRKYLVNATCNAKVHLILWANCLSMLETEFQVSVTNGKNSEKCVYAFRVPVRFGLYVWTPTNKNQRLFP